MCEGLEAWVLEAVGRVSAGGVTFDSSGRGSTPIGGQHYGSFRKMGPALGVTGRNCRCCDDIGAVHAVLPGYSQKWDGGSR